MDANDIFAGPLTELRTCTFLITNTNDLPTAFKVKTTQPKVRALFVSQVNERFEHVGLAVLCATQCWEDRTWPEHGRVGAASANVRRTPPPCQMQRQVLGSEHDYHYG